MSQPNFTRAFQDDLVVIETADTDEADEVDETGAEAEAERYTLHVRAMGELVVPSG